MQMRILSYIKKVKRRLRSNYFFKLMTYSVQQKNRLCKEYMSDINNFCNAVQSPHKSENGNCYLYYADLRFHTKICPVAGQYNIPLVKSKDTLALKDEFEVIINDSVQQEKNIIFAYVKDEIIGMFLGK
jgi:hypothetical protein